MNPFLKQQSSQISSIQSFFNNQNDPMMLHRRESYKQNSSFNQEDKSIIQSKGYKQRNSINSIVISKNSNIFGRQSSMQRNSRFTKVLNLQSANLLNRFRTKDWDVQNDYMNMSPFLSQLLEDREKYEIFLNGQQSVRLNNDIDTEIVSYILRKAQKKRCEIDYVKRALKNINIFSDTIDLFTSKDSENKLFEQFNVEFFPPQTEIIEIRKVACFIPLTWTKGIKKTPTSGNEFPQSKFSQNQAQSKQTLETKSSEILLPQNQDNQNNPSQFLMEIYHDMRYTKSFRQGEYFGEISLLTKQKRTATMVSEDDVILLTITKKGFNLLLGTKQQQDLKEKMKFLKKFPFLEILSNAKLLSLLHDIKEVDYPNNGKIVYQENDQAENIYLIKSGQVQISYKKEIPQSCKDQTINLLKSPRQMKYQKVPLIIKGPNTYFGEEDILQNQPKRTNLAEVISEEATLYVVNFKNLMIQMKFFGGQNILYDMFNLKKDWETNRRHKIDKIKDKFENQKIQMKKLRQYKTNNESFTSSSGYNPLNFFVKENTQQLHEKSLNSPANYQIMKRSSSNSITESNFVVLKHYHQKQFFQKDLNKSNQFSVTSRYSQEGSNTYRNQSSNISTQNAVYSSFNYDFVDENSPSHTQQYNNSINSSPQNQKFQPNQSQNQKFILTNGKSKKLIPILNLNQRNVSEEKTFTINSHDSEHFKILSPIKKHEKNYLLGNMTEKPTKKQNFQQNFFEDRKHSVDNLKSNFELNNNLFDRKKQINNQSDENLMHAKYNSQINESKKEMISRYDKKQDIQTELMQMLRSSMVQNTQNLVKQKKIFLSILQKRKIAGDYENFQSDYFQIPQKLLQKCLQQKKVISSEFNPNSYFQTTEPTKHVTTQELKKISQQNYYKKFFNNLVKYVKNGAHQGETEQQQ